jgi:hypothetical protein
MRKVTQHTHYVTGVMSEDDSGPPADNKMMPEVGKAAGTPDVRAKRFGFGVSVSTSSIFTPS